jgi:hypothetical protein
VLARPQIKSSLPEEPAVLTSPRPALRRLLAPLLLCTAAATAQAAPTLLVEGGLLIGANRVDVLGTSYDVRFVDGSCVSVFSGCDELSDFAFTDRASARAAAQALMADVFVDVGPGQEFDSRPELTRGCVRPSSCAAHTPFAPERFDGSLPAWGVAAASANNADMSNSSADGEFDGNLRSRNNAEVDTWARWTLSPTATPVSTPGTLASAALALGLLALTQRRRRGR